MHGLAVFQCHHAQVLSQFGNENPMADEPVRLNLAVYCFARRSLAPFTLDVRTFPQDLFLEVTGCFHCSALLNCFITVPFPLQADW